MNVQFRKESIGNQFLLEVAKMINENQQHKVQIKDNRMILPKALGSGYVSYHQLGNDIDITIFDHAYKIPACIEQLATDEVEFYLMHLNISPSEVSFSVDCNESKIAGPLSSTVFWSASNKSSCVRMKPNEPFTGISVNMTKKYLQEILGESSLAKQDTEASEMPTNSTQNYCLAGNADKHLTEQIQNLSKSVESKIGKITCELVREIINFDRSSSVSTKILLRANILKILALFIQRIAEKNDRTEKSHNSGDTTKILEVKKMIDDNAGSENLSLDDLAKTAAMSKTKLKKRFKEIMGTTAYQYYLDVKMEKAKSILEDCSIPITDLAYELGYKSTSHFSQAFKKHYGVTPTSIVLKSQAL